MFESLLTALFHTSSIVIINQSIILLPCFLRVPFPLLIGRFTKAKVRDADHRRSHQTVRSELSSKQSIRSSRWGERRYVVRYVDFLGLAETARLGSPQNQVTFIIGLILFTVLLLIVIVFTCCFPLRAFPFILSPSL